MLKESNIVNRTIKDGLTFHPLPDDSFTTQICQTLNDAGTFTDSEFSRVVFMFQWDNLGFWHWNYAMFCGLCAIWANSRPGIWSQDSTGLQVYIKSYTRSSKLCACTKNLGSKPLGLFQLLPMLPKPWSTISMDFIVEWSFSQEHLVILNTVNLLRKIAPFIPCCAVPKAQQMVWLFLENVFCYHGLQRGIILD